MTLQFNRNAKVIVAFPGCGKTYATDNSPHLSFSDSDSIGFSWLYQEDGSPVKDADGNKIRNPEFPQNYIRHIISKSHEYDVIFVSTHKETRDALIANGIAFSLVYPDKQCRTEYLKRYADRGDNTAFVKLLETNWDNWISQLEEQTECVHCVLQSNEYLLDVLPELLNPPAKNSIKFTP